MMHYSHVRRCMSMPTSHESMIEWIRKAARVNTAEESPEILEMLCNRFGRSPRAIQATIDLLHRIPPRFSYPHVTSDHLYLVFHKWQEAFLRGKHAVLSEDVVRLKLRRWAKTYGPDFMVETSIDRTMKRKAPMFRGAAGAQRLSDDSSSYEYYKVIRAWAESADADACIEISRLVDRMDDKGVALSILLGVIEDKGSMLAIPTVEAIGPLMGNGYEKLLIRTAINAGRDILHRCNEPEVFRVARDVLDTFKRYKASTPEAVHLSFDLLGNLIQESVDKDWFGSTQHFHTGLFKNYRRAARHHHLLGAQLIARRVKDWSLTGKFNYSKTTIKLLLDVAAAQHEPRDAVVHMEDIIKLLSNPSIQLIKLHSPSYRTLLQAWINSRRTEASARVQEILESAEVRLDVGVYNVALQFWCGNLENVERTVLMMHQRGVIMNSFSWLQVLRCYVRANLLEKAERALFRLNESIEDSHDEQNLANGLLELLKGYLLQAKSSGTDDELVAKCNHLYQEIALNSRIPAKTQGRIQILISQLQELGAIPQISTQEDYSQDNDIFPLYADEEECANLTD